MLAEYLSDLKRVKRVSPITLKNYRSTLTRFCAWLGDRPFDGASVNEYVSAIPHAPTANTVLTRIKALASYHSLPLKRTARAKEEVKQPNALTSWQLAKVVSCLDNVQARALVVFLAETGLRFGEYAKMSRTDWVYDATADGQEIVMLKVVGKGLKHRSVPLSPKALAVWRDVPLLPTLSQQDVFRRLLKQAGERAGIQWKVTPHTLRATFATITLNERGADSARVARILGHARLDTMMRHYWRDSNEALYRVVA
jgi:integrase/recombinase XerD